MCRIISIVNMKGGVGKTTTAVNLGIGLAKQGQRVLLLDCDSQGSLTASLGFRKPSLLEPSIATVMASIIEEDEIQDPILHHREGVDLVPANETLKGVELALVNVMSRELILKEYVSELRPDYDYIIDSVQEEASERLQEKQSVSEMVNEGHVVSGSRTSVKSDRSERKSVLGALQDKKEQVRTADGGRQEQQKAQNRPRNSNEIGI